MERAFENPPSKEQKHNYNCNYNKIVQNTRKEIF